MIRVTGATTLEELKLLRAKLGVLELTVSYEGRMPRPVVARLRTADHLTVGVGATEAEALDDALARLTHKIAEMLPQQAGRGETCP